MDHGGLTMPRAQKTTAKKQSLVYQFKIVLLEVKPLIWRRIPVPISKPNTRI
jgi:hypothetical protein